MNIYKYTLCMICYTRISCEHLCEHLLEHLYEHLLEHLYERPASAGLAVATVSWRGPYAPDSSSARTLVLIMV